MRNGAAVGLEAADKVIVYVGRVWGGHMTAAYGVVRTGGATHTSRVLGCGGTKQMVAGSVAVEQSTGWGTKGQNRQTTWPMRVVAARSDAMGATKLLKIPVR